MSDPALELAKLLNDTPELQRRLNDYVKAKTESDAAAANAEKKKSELAQAQQLLDQRAATQKSEIAAATAKHDESAKEAGLRMQGAREHEARLSKRKLELDAREAKLAEREATLSEARRHFKEATDRLASIIG
jgi:chromosome segregation ATPase